MKLNRLSLRKLILKEIKELNETYGSSSLPGVPDRIAHQLSFGGSEQRNARPMTYNTRGNFLGVADANGNVSIYRPHSSGEGEYEKVHQMIKALEAAGFTYDSGLFISYAGGFNPVYSDVKY